MDVGCNDNNNADGKPTTTATKYALMTNDYAATISATTAPATNDVIYRLGIRYLDKHFTQIHDCGGKR
jgi:hypothetical protein